jgi:YHS domain-containing protein
MKLHNTINKPPHSILPASLLLFALLALPTLSGWAEDSPKDATQEAVTHLFGNQVCPVMGDPVDPEEFVEYKDEENQVYGRIYLCCPGCDKKVKENIEKVYNSLYRTDKETGEKKDPVDLKNEKCPISDEPVSESASLEYNGFIVHFCCSGCAKEFLKNPDPVLLKLVPNPDDYKYEPPAGSGTDKKE